MARITQPAYLHRAAIWSNYIKLLNDQCLVDSDPDIGYCLRTAVGRQLHKPEVETSESTSQWDTFSWCVIVCSPSPRRGCLIVGTPFEVAAGAATAAAGMVFCAPLGGVGELSLWLTGVKVGVLPDEELPMVPELALLGTETRMTHRCSEEALGERNTSWTLKLL